MQWCYLFKFFALRIIDEGGLFVFFSFSLSHSLTCAHSRGGKQQSSFTLFTLLLKSGLLLFFCRFFFFFLRISTFLEFFFHLIFTFYALHLQTLLHYFLYNHIRSLARINVMLVLQVLSHVTLYSCHSIFLPRFKSVYHMQSWWRGCLETIVLHFLLTKEPRV